MAGPIEMDRDFFEFIECCAAHEVRFLVVDGWAMALHGHPRATKDFDVWVWLEPVNAERVVRAIEQFGFGSAGLTADDLMDPRAVVMLGHPPKRIDVLTTIDGVDFDTCWPDRVEVRIGDLDIPFIGRDHLIANKRASGRGQDLLDVETLLEEE